MNVITDNGCTRDYGKQLSPCCAWPCLRFPSEKKWFWRFVAQRIGGGMLNLFISNLHRFKSSLLEQWLKVNVSSGHLWAVELDDAPADDVWWWWHCHGDKQSWGVCMSPGAWGVLQLFPKQEGSALRIFKLWDMMEVKNWQIWSMNLCFRDTRSEP